MRPLQSAIKSQAVDLALPIFQPDRIRTEEAQARIRDPRTAGAVERTVDVLTYSLTPVDAATNVRVRNRLALIGPGILERKTAKRMTCTVLPSATRAPMIETPDDVARALRSLLAS